MCKYWQYHFRTLVAFCTENCMQTAQSSHVLGRPAILLTSLAPLPTLNKANYANVRFWTKSSYTEYQKKYKGDTNALATRKQWWGHQPKGDSKPGTDIVTWYSFLEDINGNLVPAKCLNHISIKSRQCWFSLLRAGHAPAKWRAKTMLLLHTIGTRGIQVHRILFWCQWMKAGEVCQSELLTVVYPSCQIQGG